MSYVNSADFYHNHTPVAYRDEKLAPVPGWGMRAKYMAGPRMIGVGGFGQTVVPPPVSATPSWVIPAIVVGVGLVGFLIYESMKLETRLGEAGIGALERAWR
jgi:hypothetical protein